MSTFWVAASALLIAVIAALLIPLVRRARVTAGPDHERSNVALYHDQRHELARDLDHGVISAEQFERAQLELDQRLLADAPRASTDVQPGGERRATGAWRYAVIACVPVCTVLGYLLLGSPQALDSKSIVAQPLAPADHNQNLDQLAERLSARLQANPQDTEAWVLLARSYQMLGRAPEAVKAFAQAIELVPNSAQLYADYADVQVATANGQWTQAAVDAVAKALAIDAAHPKAMWLAGTEAFARKDFGRALSYWEKLLPMAEPGTDVARMIEGNITEARQLLAAAGGAMPAQTAAKDAAAKVARSANKPQQVAGTVSLDPAIVGKVAPTDTVFVFARAAQGPKVPLAIRRVTVKELPLSFALDDSHAMAPGMTISAFPQVIVGARVSRSGDAMPKAGDYEGFSAPVTPGTQGIEIRIHAQVQ